MSMAKRFTKPSIIWVDLEKRVPPEQKSLLMAFKTRYDMHLRRIAANPADPMKINWEEYRKLIPDEKLVDKLQSSYEKFKVPFPEDTLTVKVDEQWKELEPQIQNYCADVQKEIDQAQKEVDRIKALPPFEDMTMEMFFDLYPEMALDSINNPTFWPHTPDEQLGYKPPEAEQKEIKTDDKTTQKKAK